MQVNTRLRLAGGGQALAFVLAHPDPAGAQVTTRLAGLLFRGRELAALQRTCQITITASVRLKAELRSSIWDQVMALAGISRAIARREPDLTVHLRLPRGRCSEATFMTTARVVVAEALARKELFVSNGMPSTQLDDIAADLDQYQAVLTRQCSALNAQVGATAQLTAIGLSVMRVLKHLDALHHRRFAKDPGLHAAWKTARNVAWPRTTVER
jgi:hypothetical protein